MFCTLHVLVIIIVTFDNCYMERLFCKTVKKLLINGTREKTILLVGKFCGVLFRTSLVVGTWNNVSTTLNKKTLDKWNK